MTQYTNYHIAICKDEFERKSKAGDYASNDNALSVQEIVPDYNVWRSLVDRVGGPWGWNKRPAYHENNSANIKRKLLSEGSRLFLLNKFDNTIGFCWAYPSSLKKSFGYGSDDPAMKIETFGLFKEETGKGHGQYFAPRLLSELFNSSAKTVFLETRSTNHQRVVPFYEGIGMRVINKHEDLPDDLIVA